MAIKRKPNVPFKRKPLDLPPEVGRAFIEDMRALHAAKNAIRRDEIAARASWRLKQHYPGKLRLSDVKEMFQRMWEDGR